MSWLNTSSFTSLAKTALREAQKTIDKALDIKEEISGSVVTNDAIVGNEIDKFFETFGLGTKSEKPQAEAVPPSTSEASTSVVTAEPVVSSNITASLWGSFSGSFFDPHTSGNADAVETSETPVDGSSKATTSEWGWGWESQALLASQADNKDDDGSVGSLDVVSSPEKNSPDSIVILSPSDSIVSQGSIEVVQSPDVKSSLIIEEEPSINESFHSTASASSSLTVISPETQESSEIPTLLAEAISDASSKAEVTSGQTSGDEVETTTSSDIEIISSPQLLSGMRKISDLDAASRFVKKTHQREPSEASSDESIASALELEKLTRKNLELLQIIEVRESKVMELSRANGILVEENTKLQRKLEDFEKERSVQSDSIRKMTEDFAQRISGLEKRYQQLLVEKESLEKQVGNVKLNEDLQSQLDEKEEVIRELRQEGEKLSKHQLQLSNALKKLRAKEKENETSMNQMKTRNEELTRDVERLKKSLTAKEDLERTQIEAVRQLTADNSAFEKELAANKLVVKEATMERDALRTALENAKKELSDLKAEFEARGCAEAERSLSAEVALRQQLRAEFDAETNRHQEERTALTLRIEELESTLSSADVQHHREVEQLKNELKRVMQRLHEAEARSDELSQAVTTATRPLLRQIESLQSSLGAQRLAEEKTEKLLNERLSEAVAQCTAAEEKEKQTRDSYLKLQARASQLEFQLSSVTQEKNQLSTQVEMLRMKLQALEEGKNKEVSSLEMVKKSLTDELAQMRAQLRSLEHRVELEISALEAEKRRTVLLEEQLKEKERHLRSYSVGPEPAAAAAALPAASTEVTSQSMTSRASSPTPSLGRVSTSGSLSESFSSNPWAINDDVFYGNAATPVPRATLYDSLRSGPNASVFENLQSQLKVREGEVQQLQQELLNVERSREALTQELTRVVALNEETQQRLDSLEKLREEFDDLHKKYNALLQMYGEKVEENEELKLDLVDVKEMYKAQIDQLLRS